MDNDASAGLLDGLEDRLFVQRFDGGEVDDFRADAILGQFCRKLLGYALGREVQLSDEPLLSEVMERLAKNDYRFSVAVEMIVQSRQFREIRGREAQRAKAP